MNKKTILITLVIIGIVVAGTFLVDGSIFQGRLDKNLKKDFQTRPEVTENLVEYSPLKLTMVLEDNKPYLVHLYWTDPNPKNIFMGPEYKVYRSTTTPVEFTSKNLIGTTTGINLNNFPKEVGTYYYAVEINDPAAAASRSNEVSTTLTKPSTLVPQN